MREIKRALISVYDKKGVVDFAKKLSESGVEIISSGGTYSKLKEAGIHAIEISDYTGSPEVMGGRVKTLHPRVHGGILFRRDDASDVTELEKLGGKPIDMVVVNLYPFAETIAKPDCDMEMALKNIDIGGPTMVRAAAKNWTHVVIVTDPTDYDSVLTEMHGGGISDTTAQTLAAKAFALTSSYDSMITSYLGKSDSLPEAFTTSWKKESELRYGENPHQKAALYLPNTTVAGPNLASANKIQGKEISYNNLLDADAALNLIKEFDQPAALALKHNNPCGVAVSENIAEAFVKARDCDPQSAFGGIIAINREADGPFAEEVTSAFYEVVLAPSFSKEALGILSKKKNLRVLEIPNFDKACSNQYQYRLINGGLLLQEVDGVEDDESSWKVATNRAPTTEEMNACKFAWKVCKHVKSNAIIFCSDTATLGIGAGQMSRIDSVKLAQMKARTPLKGSVVASDAFFPFADGMLATADAGATAVIQPGGSMRDDEVIQAANERNIAMILTGKRHFRH